MAFERIEMGLEGVVERTQRLESQGKEQRDGAEIMVAVLKAIRKYKGKIMEEPGRRRCLETEPDAL